MAGTATTPCVSLGLALCPQSCESRALIQEVQTDDFWRDIATPILENVPKKLRALSNALPHSDCANVLRDAGAIAGGL